MGLDTEPSPEDADRQALHERCRARVGLRLGDRFLVGGLLGVGGMGAVYAASGPDGREVALKVLHPHLAATPSIKRRFALEGKLGRLVVHPDAVVAQDAGETEQGEPFLVLERLHGQTLDERLGAGRLDPPQALAIALAVLGVLEAAHAAGVVHRDIKPSNVFLPDEGGVKLLDFGIARVRAEATSTTLQTRPGAARGTPAFMAPEQARGAEADARTDVWAVGALLFCMLAGRAVHTGDNVAQILFWAGSQPAPPLGPFAPQVHAGVARVVDVALAFEPGDRWPSARAMREALGGLSDLRSAPSPVRDESTLPEPTSGPAPVAPRSALPARPVGGASPAAASPALGAGALALALGAALVVLTRSPPAPAPSPLAAASLPAAASPPEPAPAAPAVSSMPAAASPAAASQAPPPAPSSPPAASPRAAAPRAPAPSASTPSAPPPAPASERPPLPPAAPSTPAPTASRDLLERRR